MVAGVSRALFAKQVLEQNRAVEIPKDLIAGVTLIDGIQRNAEAPKTFHIPDPVERENAKIGDFVKIGLEGNGLGGERFWVEVTYRVDDGRYIGRIDNDLADKWGVNFADLIMFEPRHILATQ